MFRTLARPLLASAFAVDGSQMLLNSNEYAEDAKAINGTLRSVLPQDKAGLIPDDAETTVRVVGTTKVVASALLATGKAPRLAAATLAAVQIPTALSRHAFWNASNGAERKEEIRGLVTDLALLGGLVITSADTAGKPGLKWRAQQAMPGKTEQQKMLENAQTQSKAFAASASDQAQGFFAKTKEVAGQVQDKVADYVDEHQDEWKETAENLRERAAEFGDQASDYAQSAAAKAQDAWEDFDAEDLKKDVQKATKKSRKRAQKTQKQAQKRAKKAQKKAQKRFK